MSNARARRAAGRYRDDPGIVRDRPGAQIRTVPGLDTALLLRQRRQALGGGRIASDIEIVEIERARKALDLNPGGLHLGFAQIVEDARTHQRHDHADDRDDDQNLDQGEAALAMPASRPPRGCVSGHV